ncbi:MAG: DUF445 domain-containing protein, partial [Bradyrhizobium sp.]|nr:DUF445 domain-containing protein [Bradyrhizobium sp.]
MPSAIDLAASRLRRVLAPAPSAMAGERRAGLRRMRFFATALLVLMLVLFILTSIGERELPWLAYLRAFAEAGMIGACADWFAVVALFRHPLGLPIPHTAIVPHSKERIGIAIGRFIANNFLSPRVLAERIRDVDFSGWVARWILRGGNARNVAQRATLLLQRGLRALPREDFNAFMGEAVRRGIEAVPAAPLASRLLSLLWAHGEMQTVIEHLLDHTSAALGNNRELIKSKVAKQTSRLIPKWIDGLLADKIIAGVRRILDEMREPGHPWRVELAATVTRLIDDLATDPGLAARGEEIKANLLSTHQVTGQIDALLLAIEDRLDDAATQARLTDMIEQLLIAIGERLLNDARIHDGVNRWLRVAVLRTVAPRRAEIAAFIRKVVENWDTETLVERIELQVGRDLQYIRINGTLVGGLVG